MKKSFLEEFKEVQNTLDRNADNYNSHFIIGVDLQEDGAPNASIMISNGAPFNTLGMIDLLIKNLQDVKKDVLHKLSTKYQKDVKLDSDSLIDRLPEEIKDKVISIKKRMDAAMDNGDAEELRKLKIEILNLKNPFSNNDDKKDDDDDNFNISDFKGGMA